MKLCKVGGPATVPRRFREAEPVVSSQRSRCQGLFIPRVQRPTWLDPVLPVIAAGHPGGLVTAAQGGDLGCEAGDPQDFCCPSPPSLPAASLA